jgi:hypothetical protein
MTEEETGFLDLTKRLTYPDVGAERLRRGVIYLPASASS